jgi:DNA-binding NarL/FixJ family response regulator
MIKVLLVDSQAAVRRGLHMWLALEPDLDVVGEASSTGDGLALVEELAPDVVLVETGLLDASGITAVQRIQQVAPHSAVVALSLHGGAEMRARADAAGAQAFVEKDCGAGQLLEEIHRVAGKPAGRPSPSRHI